MPRITDGKPKASSHFMEGADKFLRSCDIADALPIDLSESRHSVMFVQMPQSPADCEFNQSSILLMQRMAAMRAATAAS